MPPSAPDIESAEASLVYAVRRYFDLAGSSAVDAGPAEGASSILAIQLHVLALRMRDGYRRLFKIDPPAFAYTSLFLPEEADEATRLLQAWRSYTSDADLRVLAGLNLPADLARSLLEGKTAHYPAGLKLDDMVRHWMLTVLDLERGYPRDHDDFQHDRGVRDAIEAIAEEASPSLRATIHGALEPWDERFRQVMGPHPISYRDPQNL